MHKQVLRYISISILLFFTCTFSAYSQKNNSLVIDYCYINSIPQNAGVYLNNTLVGETPVRFYPTLLDSTKENSIIIKLTGYYDYSLTLEKGGIPINKSIYLVAKPGNLTAIVNRQVLENTENYFRTPRKVIPIVVSAALTGASGFLSYYFKQLSNDRYDEYQNTGDASLLDKKRKYDIISGVSLAVFQIAIAGLVYFLFID